ncbi:glycoside hydrolase family 16 protein [Jaapia argillacea MUCL 33604]|uniref:Glycoside hydrolase family 16 protein n=1 Tax=Jaapia argillacea MUCL 33604 TaxID=933084 RepID=A0A067PM27_9AGAM|nr:glycoside hydrolase family 16 protein [Jaapia argillacea MUCL 33604]
MHFLPAHLILLILSIYTLPVASEALFHRAHRHAIKRSAGFARDLRVAFKGLGLPVGNLEGKRSTPVTDAAVGQIYCVSQPSKTPGVGSSTGNGTTNGPANGSHPSSKGSPTRTATSAGATSTLQTNFKMIESHQGNNFFNGWNFFTGSDPTNGIVQYVDGGTAINSNLISTTSSGTAIMRVDNTSVIGATANRQSVRITTASTFTMGLVILDAAHMPQGCGTWPAFWTNGPKWPQGGEIDIVEGVNDYTVNQATIHTNPGCSIPTLTTTNALNSNNPLAITGTLVATTNCAAAETNNAGCGIRSNDDTSYGSGFNGIGGGVYAMLWDTTGISVFFFARSNIPVDISGNAPNPSSWGTPMARYPATQCNPQQFFYNHSVIFDTTLCGDWASGVWSSTGVTGQEQSCAQRTGYSTCESFVRNQGSAFTDAYWEVNYVQIWQQK